MNFIEPAFSDWASRIYLSAKDGSLHFHIDYKKLNDVIIKDVFPIPQMDKCLDSLDRRSHILDAGRQFWVVANQDWQPG